MSAPQPNIGDFLVCYDPLKAREIFRCIVIEEKPDKYETIVLLHNEDGEENGLRPGDKFSMGKPDYKELFRAPCDIDGTYWRIEEMIDGT